MTFHAVQSEPLEIRFPHNLEIQRLGIQTERNPETPRQMSLPAANNPAKNVVAGTPPDYIQGVVATQRRDGRVAEGAGLLNRYTV